MKIGMSAGCVYPLSVDEAFRLSAAAGYDGVEVMVTNDKTTQSVDALLELAEEHGQPILSVHAPVLLLTHFVWGRDPQVKLEKSAELAAAVGASTVVVHPPFRWQATYADKFLDIVRQTHQNTGVEIAVENMFPWAVGDRSVQAYAPGPDPRELDCDHITLDFSHAALSGHNSLDLAKDFGERLRHVHLCDGATTGDDGRIFDEHLLPGYGIQPVAETLQHLTEIGWSGHIVAEINTRKSKNEAERLAALVETLEFARRHTNQVVSNPVTSA